MSERACRGPGPLMKGCLGWWKCKMSHTCTTCDTMRELCVLLQLGERAMCVATRWELVSKGNIMDLSAHPHGPVFPHCSSPIPPLPLMPPASFVSTKLVSWSFHFLLLLLSSSSPTLVHPAQRFRSTSEPRRMKRLLCRCICIFFTC